MGFLSPYEQCNSFGWSTYPWPYTFFIIHLTAEWRGNVPFCWLSATCTCSCLYIVNGQIYMVHAFRTVLNSLVVVSVCSRCWTTSLLSGVCSLCPSWNQWLADDLRRLLQSPWAVYMLPWQQPWQQVWLLWPLEVPRCVLVLPARMKKLMDMLVTSWKNRYRFLPVEYLSFLSLLYH